MTANAQRDDEIGQLVSATDQARLAWITAIGDIRIATERIARTSGDIALGANTLNERSGNAAASLRQTAESMGGLLNMVEASTASARKAADLAGTGDPCSTRRQCCSGRACANHG